jgi:hypothetical protein
MDSFGNNHVHLTDLHVPHYKYLESPIRFPLTPSTSMRVLLLGVTGRVGSRLLPALVAHKHTVVAYVRDPTKLSHDVASRTSSILTGCATDSDALTAAILSNNCDVVINAAGFAHVIGSGGRGDLPSIFSSVSKAVQDAKAKRGGPPLRCWFLSGWPLMDSPNKPHLIMD